jgi:hypothetical protein
LHTTLLVIWILDRVYGLIFHVKVYIIQIQQARESMYFNRECESMYLVKNPCNEYVLQQSDCYRNLTGVEEKRENLGV